MKISKYFTKQECTRSTTASRLGIKNEPSPEQWENIKLFMNNCMDKIRELFNVPIVPNSVFRSLELNTKIGGSKTSMHMEGLACDFAVPGISVTNAVKRIIASGIEFDQVIDEYGSWVHIGWRPTGNRKQKLKVRRIGRKSVWTNIT